jgi:hypothetical protein
MAETPETSEFTSIKQRIKERQPEVESSNKQNISNTPPSLLLKTFVPQGYQLTDEIPYHYHEYLELVDWSGRVMRAGKRGAINDRLPPILTRLGVDTEEWHKAMQPKGAHQFSRAMGRCDAL